MTLTVLVLVACTPIMPTTEDHSFSSSSSDTTKLFSSSSSLGGLTSQPPRFVKSGYRIAYHNNYPETYDPSYATYDWYLSSGTTTKNGEWDAAVVYIDPVTQNWRIVIPSVKDALPELKDQFNRTLSIVAQPHGANAVFTQVLMQTDAGHANLYRIDEQTQKLVKMGISEDYNKGLWGAASNEQRYVAVTHNKADEPGVYRHLKVLDMVNDTIVADIVVESSKAISIGEELWKVSTMTFSGSVLRYGVYDAQAKLLYDGPEPEPVEFRTIDVSKP